MENRNLPIKLVAQKTGLSAHVIRVWEKRYGVVVPTRSAGRQRLYTEEEIARLQALAGATRLGHRISDIAKLKREDLEQLLEESPAARAPANGGAEQLLGDAMKAISAYDGAALEQLLRNATLRFGQHGVMEKVLGPLARELGTQWHSGAITAAQEHFASNVIRMQLLSNTNNFAPNSTAPLMISTTPAGQLHELGAAMASAAARDLGWRVDYLGPSLPAAEIAGAALQRSAQVVALSIIHPADDPLLPDELRKLRSFLPVGTLLMVGGSAAPSYASVLKEIKAEILGSMDDFYRSLEAFRRRGPASKTIET